MNEEQLQNEESLTVGELAAKYPSATTGRGFAEATLAGSSIPAGWNQTTTYTAPSLHQREWTWNVGPNTVAGGHDDEVAIREKAVEYAIQASGDKDLNLKEFSNLLDFFYTYLKTGEKLNF